jgi:hypothetical protein
MVYFVIFVTQRNETQHNKKKQKIILNYSICETKRTVLSLLNRRCHGKFLATRLFRPKFVLFVFANQAKFRDANFPFLLVFRETKNNAKSLFENVPDLTFVVESFIMEVAIFF